MKEPFFILAADEAGVEAVFVEGHGWAAVLPEHVDAVVENFKPVTMRKVSVTRPAGSEAVYISPRR